MCDGRKIRLLRLSKLRRIEKPYTTIRHSAVRRRAEIEPSTQVVSTIVQPGVGCCVMQREQLRAEDVRANHRRAPLMPTPQAYSSTVNKVSSYSRTQRQFDRDRRPTLRQVIREGVVGAQSRWRREDRGTPVRQKSVHRVTDHRWSINRSTRSRPR